MKMKNFILLTFLSVVIWGCTRDDICTGEGAATPRLLIEFRDISNRLESKAVTSLRILVNDADTLEVFFGESDTLAIIPLNSIATQSEFQFIRNFATDTINRNTDIVTFSYEPNDVYVNRACAFKTVFSELQVEVSPEGNANWIRDATLLKTNIEDETEAHLTIFH